MGAGTALNVEEKDFMDGLYTVVQRMTQQPFAYNDSDFLAFLKCLNIVFVQKRQFSTEVINSFGKRLV